MKYATEAQINYIESLEAQLGVNALRVHEEISLTFSPVYVLEDLSRYEASCLIDQFKADLEEKKRQEEAGDYSYSEDELDFMYASLDC